MGKRVHITITDFEQIFREYYVRLCRYAYSFVNDESVSEDIVSEVYSCLWRKREELEYSNISSYLYISVHNRSINYLRNLQGQNKFLERWKMVLATDNPSAQANLEERIAEMKKVIDQMAPKTRFVLEQCYMEGHSYQEVATMLSITTDGVKKHIVKAFAMLREHFNVKKR